MNTSVFDAAKPPFPMSEPVARKAYAVNVDEWQDRGSRLAAISLQGLVNRTAPEFYMRRKKEHNTSWCLDYYKEQNYIDSYTVIETLDELLERYANRVKGAVIYDPDKTFTVNTATNIAGTESRIIISPDLADTVKRHGITDIKDIRELNFSDPAQAYEWERDNCLHLQNKDVLGCLCFEVSACDNTRDYLIQFNIHTFWMPGKNDDGYLEKTEALIEQTLRETQTNIPIIGFWYSSNGKTIFGKGEFDGVQFGGFYGKYTVVNDHAGNYSYHSGIPADLSDLKQNKARNKKKAVYEPNKKYVAFVMIESGDAPVYLQGIIQKNQWWDEDRGSFPIAYGITPTFKFLAPGLMKDLYDTATENDFFFCAISGMGYCYPLEGYGSKCEDPEAVINEYFERTVYQLKTLDIDMLGLYTHVWTAYWNEHKMPADHVERNNARFKRDEEYINKYITKYPQIRSVIESMGRDDDRVIGNAMLDNDTTVHNTLTRWSWDNYVNPFFEEKDEEAIDFVVREIRDNAGDNQFIQAMFYSWHYGPRRLKEVVARLEKEGFEFVSLLELDEMYREHGLK